MIKKHFRQLWERISSYNAFIDEYTKASQASADPAMAHVNWGIELAQSGQLTQALEKFEKAAAMAPDRPEILNNWGVALAKMGDLDAAAQKFKAALVIEPTCINSFVLWGAALLEQGDVAAAQEKYEKAVQLNPGNPEPYVNWGIALSRMGRYHDAIKHFQAALAIYSYQPQVFFLWGAVLAELELFEEAIEKFKITLRYMPKHPEAYYFWAMALNRLGRYEEAIEKSRKALDLNPNNPEIFLNMGDVFANLGEYEQAIQNYNQVSLMDPELADTFMNWGIALCKLGRHQEGYQHFEKALDLEPGLTQAHYYWGASLNENRQYQEALPHLVAMYDEKPDHLDNLINLGLAKIHTGAFDAGYQLLKEAEKLDPWHPQINFLIGTYQLSQGQAKWALEYLKKAIEAKNDFTDAAINLSLAFCELGNTEEAVRTLRPFMRYNQDSPEVNFFYGTILYRHGDLKEAIVKFNRALAIRDNYAEPLLGLAEIAIRQDELKEAQALLSRLRQAHGEFVPGLYLSGVVEGKLAERDQDVEGFEKAKSFYEQACQIAPDHLEAQVNWAYLCGKTDGRETMNAKFSELLQDKRYPEPLVQNYWAQALEELGYPDEAMLHRENALKYQ